VGGPESPWFHHLQKLGGTGHMAPIGRLRLCARRGGEWTACSFMIVIDFIFWFNYLLIIVCWILISLCDRVTVYYCLHYVFFCGGKKLCAFQHYKWLRFMIYSINIFSKKREYSRDLFVISRLALCFARLYTKGLCLAPRIVQLCTTSQTYRRIAVGLHCV